MIIKKMSFSGLGPFANDAHLDLDPNVTVLTGANDTGKSFVLDMLSLVSVQEAFAEKYINLNYLQSSNIAWEENPHIRCSLTFQTTTLSKNYIQARHTQNTLESNHEVTIDFCLAPNLDQKQKVSIAQVKRQGSIIHNAEREYLVKDIPRVIRMPLMDEIRPVIDCSDLNFSEQKFIEHAFGLNFVEKSRNWSDVNLINQIEIGKGKLNSLLARILPRKSKLEINLVKVSAVGQPLKLQLVIQDRIGMNTPIHFRGTGIRKIMSLMAALLDIKPESEHVYILFDEPETSLHSDAQHSLRFFLEELGSRKNIQVIYATHSPSMINNFRVDGVRLLQREQVNGNPVTIINNSPYMDNFLMVRSNLGLTPADSLLYAPIIIIVEGLTEILCLPLLLEKFCREGIPGFEEVEILIPLIRFLEGYGDEYEYWCRMVKSQGAKPILFLDGDKKKRIDNSQVLSKHQDVPVLFTGDSIHEFENIVPALTYFEALSTELEDEYSLDEFKEWLKESNQSAKMAFSKKVELWLKTKKKSFSKPFVMKKAVTLTATEDIEKEALRQLVDEMMTILQDI